MTDDTAKQGALVRGLGAADRMMSVAERGIMALVSATLVVIMAMVAMDAIFRYALNNPLSFNYDLVQMYLLPLVMLMPVGFMMRRGGHISVDLFASLMPARMRQLVLGIALILSAPVFWIMFTRIGLMALESWEKGLETTGVIKWPIWASQAVYCVAMGGLTIRLVHIGVTNLLAFLTGRDELEISVLSAHDDPLEEAI